MQAECKVCVTVLVSSPPFMLLPDGILCSSYTQLAFEFFHVFSLIGQPNIMFWFSLPHVLPYKYTFRYHRYQTRMKKLLPNTITCSVWKLLLPSIGGIQIHQTGTKTWKSKLMSSSAAIYWWNSQTSDKQKHENQCLLCKSLLPSNGEIYSWEERKTQPSWRTKRCAMLE